MSSVTSVKKDSFWAPIKDGKYSNWSLCQIKHNLLFLIVKIMPSKRQRFEDMWWRHSRRDTRDPVRNHHKLMQCHISFSRRQRLYTQVRHVQLPLAIGAKAHHTQSHPTSTSQHRHWPENVGPFLAVPTHTLDEWSPKPQLQLCTEKHLFHLNSSVLPTPSHETPSNFTSHQKSKGDKESLD